MKGVERHTAFDSKILLDRLDFTTFTLIPWSLTMDDPGLSKSTE